MAGAVAADCPEGYEVVGSKCILRYTGGYLTYDEAATYCTQHFGRLPVLKDCASFIDVTTYVNDGCKVITEKHVKVNKLAEFQIFRFQNVCHLRNIVSRPS